MSHLPPAAPREQVHTRQVRFNGYRREDGFWDVEVELSDVKPYGWPWNERNIPAGEPHHGMAIRLTIDDELVVRAIVAAMESRPYEECTKALEPMQAIVGCTMGAGWRRAVDKAIGGVHGCTHMREMLYNAATAAYQMVWPHKLHLMHLAGEPLPQPKEPPVHLGRCMSWRFDGPVVMRYHPQFYRAPEKTGEDT